MATSKAAELIQGKTPTEIKRAVRSVMLERGYTLQYSREVSRRVLAILAAPPVAERPSHD